jgi:hypothetical protein
MLTAFLSSLNVLCIEPCDVGTCANLRCSGYSGICGTMLHQKQGPLTIVGEGWGSAVSREISTSWRLLDHAVEVRWNRERGCGIPGLGFGS